MRKDMHKVLTTRPRFGGNTTGKRKAFDKRNQTKERRLFKGADVDTSPKKESMRKRHKVDGDSKEFSDHLRPIQRWLLKQVGRPWNDVWSEICKHFRGNGLQAAHIKMHIKWEVGGVPHSGETFFEPDDWHSGRRGVVYVDEKGILRKPKPRRRYYRDPKYRVIEGKTYAENDYGWFEVDLVWVGERPVELRWDGRRPYYEKIGKVYDALFGREMRPEELFAAYGTYYRCTHKRPLSKKQLRKLGLRKS